MNFYFILSNKVEKDFFISYRGNLAASVASTESLFAAEMFNLSFENFLFSLFCQYAFYGVNNRFWELAKKCRKQNQLFVKIKKSNLKRFYFNLHVFTTTLKSSLWGDKLSCNIHLHVHLTRKITESSNQSGIAACAIMLHMGRWALRIAGLYNSYN